MDAQLFANRRTVATRFELSLPVEMRLCRESDLPALEWFGAFTEHRQIIRQAFERQQRGENLMLLALGNGFPVGQVWIDLQKSGARGAGFLWALRVFPALQGRGLGQRLIEAAEALLHQRGFASAELAVDNWNVPALSLYQRLGYTIVDSAQVTESYETPEGIMRVTQSDRWFLRKRLNTLDQPVTARTLGQKTHRAAPRLPKPSRIRTSANADDPSRS